MPKLRRVLIKDRHYLVKYRKERSPRHALKSKGKLTPIRHIRETKTEKIQKILGITIGAYLVNCYMRNLMSCQEIVENIQRICNVSISRQTIWKILKRYEGVLRHQAESMKVRAITGRMDYTKSTKHIDYKHMHKDYKKICEKRRKGGGTSKKTVLLNPQEIKEIKKFAKDNKLTISDALKITYFPNTNYKKYGIQERIRLSENRRSLNCKRCGYTWIPRLIKVKVCPRCQSVWWDTERNQGERKKRRIEKAKRNCKFCSKIFLPKEKLKSFCSKRCRRAYHKSIMI